MWQTWPATAPRATATHWRSRSCRIASAAPTSCTTSKPAWLWRSPSTTADLRPPGAALREQLPQSLLVEHLDAELLGLSQFRSGALAGHDIVGLARHRPGDPSPGGHDHLARLLPGELGQGAGEHERLAGQRPLAGGWSLLLEREALALEVRDELDHLLVVELLVDLGGHL